METLEELMDAEKAEMERIRQQREEEGYDAYVERVYGGMQELMGGALCISSSVLEHLDRDLAHAWRREQRLGDELQLIIVARGEAAEAWLHTVQAAHADGDPAALGELPGGPPAGQTEEVES